MTQRQTPEEIAAERKREREAYIHHESKQALALEHIADTLESLRQDVRALVDAMISKERA